MFVLKSTYKKIEKENAENFKTLLNKKKELLTEIGNLNFENGKVKIEKARLQERNNFLEKMNANQAAVISEMIDHGTIRCTKTNRFMKFSKWFEQNKARIYKP